MAEKAPGSERDTQRIEAEIVRLKEDLGRDADKVAGIRRHRRIRTILSAGVGGILFGTPTFIVYSEAGLFATLVGAFVGFGVMQLYFLIVPSQFAIGSIVRRHRSAEEKLGLLFDERRRRMKEMPVEASAVESPAAPNSQQRVSRKRRRIRK
jgi:hypothetical protein